MVIPFLTIYMTRELGFSLVEAGYVMSFFGLGSILGTYIGGQLTDRFGYYPIMVTSLILTGFMFFFLNYAQSFWSISLMIFMTSTIADTFRPANMTAVALLSDEKDRTRSVTLIRLAINAGWSIGPAIGGILIAGIGYKFLFLADGLTNIAAAFVLMLLLKEKYVGNKKEEKKEIKTKVKWKSSFIWLMIVNAIAMIAFFQFFNTIPIFFRSELNLTEDVIGLLMAINGMFLVLFEMPVVYNFEGKYDILRLIGKGILLIGLSFLVLLFDGGVWIAALCIVIISVGEILNMPFTNSYVMSVADEKNMGKYMAMYGVSFSLSFVVAPTLGLFVVELYGYNALWILLMVLSTIAYLMLYYFVIRKESHSISM